MEAPVFASASAAILGKISGGIVSEVPRHGAPPFSLLSPFPLVLIRGSYANKIKIPDIGFAIYGFTNFTVFRRSRRFLDNAKFLLEAPPPSAVPRIGELTIGNVARGKLTFNLSVGEDPGGGGRDFYLERRRFMRERASRHIFRHFVSPCGSVFISRAEITVSDYRYERSPFRARKRLFDRAIDGCRRRGISV